MVYIILLSDILIKHFESKFEDIYHARLDNACCRRNGSLNKIHNVRCAILP